MKHAKWLLVLAAALGSGFACNPSLRAQNGDLLWLENGWQIQPAQAAGASGAVISSAAFSAAGWQPAKVPTTVLGALVNDGIYTNVFFGTNLANISRNTFAGPWWFRSDFRLSPEQSSNQAELIFEGLNYRANVWLNGQQLATTNDVFGAFRMFHLATGGRLKPGNNVLAVEVFPPQPGDFTLGFVDWNPQPADREMGLFRPVKLHFFKSVAIENVFVETKLDHANWQGAALTLHAELRNPSDREAQAIVTGDLGGVACSETFSVPPGATRSIAMTPQSHSQLTFTNAQLWWPWELGEPYLYHLKLTVAVAGEVSDHAETSFGIREVSDYVSPEGYRGYQVNGRKLLLRGGGWADELLLREDEQNLEAQIQYTKAMNLNTIRLEGFWGSSQRLYDLADENGLLIMAGFSCQWEWKEHLGKDCDNFGGFKTEADFRLATNYLRDQVLWLRNHPSVVVWVLGSDKLPRPELEAKYDALLAVIDPTRPKLKTCGDGASKLSGPSAVKMNGPYDYVPPNYWYLDTEHGGAFGFNTETGPGPQPPPLESLRRMLPASHLWPIDNVWNFHCARGEFGQMKRYLNAFTNRYGAAASVEEFAFKSQAANYEAMRPMYESFGANLPHTTGIIQWMLNPSWPKLYWQLYDYYLVPGGAFFGAKRGAAPLAVIYHYGERGIYLVNQTPGARGDMMTTLTVYDLNSRIILATNLATPCPAYGAKKLFDLSGLAPETPVYFLDLSTQTPAGRTCAENFYWLSTKPDVLDEARTQWNVTPEKSSADFTALNHLPPATVDAKVDFQEVASQPTRAVVTLTNRSDHLAFFLELRIVDTKSQQSLTPVLWDDNYISLPPHAKRTYFALLPEHTANAELKLQGWNTGFQSFDK